MQSKLISIGTESKKFDDDCDGIDEAMTEIDVENHYYIYNYHRQNVSQPDHFLFQTKSLDCSVQKIFEQKKKSFNFEEIFHFWNSSKVWNQYPIG